MRALQPIPTSAHSNSSMFVPTNLKSCSHVFLRVDSVQPPLSQNYTGPHEVIPDVEGELGPLDTVDEGTAKGVGICVRVLEIESAFEDVDIKRFA
ncbi:hypothetical protein TNIN_171361 [Trichonephila inaurata madagascariensis]|uniref:Uncharacterized protein n=1 Tax=Trichonephila inaurata madagascariensis TaxID=2747483 RepID=A0A8X7CTU3_9ARAC|nr:hypothetical protein TNIN_171361 [Trichonephila inaurata madagascariensis]